MGTKGGEMNFFSLAPFLFFSNDLVNYIPTKIQ